MFQFSQFMLSYWAAFIVDLWRYIKCLNSYSFKLVANVKSIFTLLIKCFNFDVIVFLLFKFSVYVLYFVPYSAFSVYSTTSV